MICIGIESTAHTFGVGIMDNEGKVLADARNSYVPPEGWGIEPAKAGEHHRKVKESVLADALGRAGIEWKDIDMIAFSQGPGLPPCLSAGKDFSIKLAREHSKPLYPVNHPIGHIEIAKLMTGTRDPVIVYASGGNTQTVAYSGGYYRVFGETQDIGIGNALDKLGRELGIGFPAGPEIEKLARGGKYIELPYVVKGMDLCFSGILTSAINMYKKGEKINNVCFSFQETTFSMLTEVTERAMAYTGKEECIFTGGVAANGRLKKMLDTMCSERGARFYSCPIKYCGDNGTMIAWTGLLKSRKGKPEPLESIDMKPGQRVDDVRIEWI